MRDVFPAARIEQVDAGQVVSVSHDAPPWQTDLDVGDASVRRARRFAQAFANASHVDGVAADLVLVTSELVSNAMRHAHHKVRLSLTHRAHEVLVEVHDDGGGEPTVERPDASSPSGRGLLIVQGLTRRWGTLVDADGKTVWAVLNHVPAADS